MTPALLPVGPGLLHLDAHARIEAFEHEGAGADRLRPILEPVRNHQEMVVRQAVRQVSVRRAQRNPDLVIVKLLDVGDALHGGGAARFRLAAMKVERIDGVVGSERLAVRERDALAQLEDPVLRAAGRLPALGELRMRLAVHAPFGEAIPEAVIDGDHHRIVRGPEVEAVRGAAAGETELERAAGLGDVGGLGCAGLCGNSWRGRGSRLRALRCAQRIRGARSPRPGAGCSSGQVRS